MSNLKNKLLNTLAVITYANVQEEISSLDEHAVMKEIRQPVDDIVLHNFTIYVIRETHYDL